MSADTTGYEYDYSGATAKEYAEYVYNEYRWKGRNYKGQHAPEIVELVRTWLKETYPRYRFSVRRENYNSIYIKLMSADFEAFTKESGKVQDTINHYNIEWNPDLTDRAKEVMMNVCDFVMSYNFDDSNAMTDYFHTNFYLTLGIGSYRKPYKVELPKLACKGKEKQEVFKHPEGTAHKTLRQALGTARFGFIEHRRHIGRDDTRGRPLRLTRRALFLAERVFKCQNRQQKRIDKLEQAGMRCRLTGYNGGYIQFLGYTPETKTLLESRTRRGHYCTSGMAGKANTNQLRQLEMSKQE